MRRKLGILILAFLTLTMIACTKNETELIYEKYTVKYDCLEYVAYVESVEKKIYTLTDENELKVSNGEIVEKDQILYTIDTSSYEETKKKIDIQINNIHEDINSNNKKINSKKNEISSINDKIAICNDKVEEAKNKINNEIYEKESLDEEFADETCDQEIETEEEIKAEIAEYNSELKILNEEIESLSNENIQLQRQLTELEIDLEYNIYRDSETAPFKGQVIIDGETIYLYSLEYEVIYNATQEQTKIFGKDNEYAVSKDDIEIGTAKVKYIIPCDKNTEQGVNAIYRIGFDISTDETLLRNSIVNIIEKSNELLIPFDFVFEDAGKYYVKLNGEEKDVSLEKGNSSYKVISGINENDILESYEGKAND